jgi:hypothetical protein
MANDPRIERIRQAEEIVATLCEQGAMRLSAIAQHIRQATNNPQFPDAEILTALCNLSDLGKIRPNSIGHYLHYATPAAWAKHNAQPTPKPSEAPNA